MDGPEGERHAEYGAILMSKWFDDWHNEGQRWMPLSNAVWSPWVGPWGQFCLFHSRFLAKSYGECPSRLCVADKLAIVLTPAWLYLPMVRLTGEIHEYMALAMAKQGMDAKYSTMGVSCDTQRQWYRDVQDYLRRWVSEHKDGREDTWTPDQKQTVKTGVWK